MLLYALALFHLTTVTFSIFIHRSIIHRAVVYHPIIAHAFRFYVWLTLAAIHKNIMGVHRIHHVKSDTARDPYSPHTNAYEFYFKKIWMTSVPITNPEHLEYINKFAPDAPNDWIERNLYSRYYWLGLVVFIIFNVLIWGMIGLVLALIPFLTQSLTNLVIGGLSHTIGYRYEDTDDRSHNLCPIGILFSGEEFHHNHHVRASSAKFSVKWYEFDLGWLYISILVKLGLAQTK